MNQKTKEVLLRSIEEHNGATITVIMKTCYLIDLIATKRIGEKITELEYIRYNYGPFNPNIYKFIMELIENEIVDIETSYFGVGNEVAVYKIKNNYTIETSVNPREKSIIDEVLASIRGLGAKILTEITYQTPPMKILGATLGGNENIGKKLNLKT